MTNSYSARLAGSASDARRASVSRLDMAAILKLVYISFTRTGREQSDGPVLHRNPLRRAEAMDAQGDRPGQAARTSEPCDVRSLSGCAVHRSARPRRRLPRRPLPNGAARGDMAHL